MDKNVGFTGFHCMLGIQRFQNLCRRLQDTWQCSPCIFCSRGVEEVHEESFGYVRLALLSMTFPFYVMG